MVEQRVAYTPESLLRVAVAVFNERGYDGTSMEQLAQAAGITKSSIYHHVRGKEDMLRQALERATGVLFALLDEPDATTGRAIDRLRYVVRRATEVLIEDLPYVTLLLRARGNTETERWALDRRRELDHRVADLVAQAAADGDLRTDVEPRLAARLLFGLVNSVSEWYRPGHAGTTPSQVGQAVAAIAFDGLVR